MDPLEIVLPYHEVDEMLLKIRKRLISNAETSLPASKRPRAETNALLPFHLQSPKEEPIAPRFEEDLKKYDKGRLQAGLHLVQSAQSKCNITPRTQQFLIVYKDSYKTALQIVEENGNTDAAITVCQTLDRVYKVTRQSTAPNPKGIRRNWMR